MPNVNLPGGKKGEMSMAGVKNEIGTIGFVGREVSKS